MYADRRPRIARDELPLIRVSTHGVALNPFSPGRAGAHPYRDAGETFRSSVRELRQRRAYYRCCIPALAGFVSHRSIAPDGFSIIRLDDSPEQRLSRERSQELGGAAQIVEGREDRYRLNARMSASRAKGLRGHSQLLDSSSLVSFVLHVCSHS